MLRPPGASGTSRSLESRGRAVMTQLTFPPTLVAPGTTILGTIHPASTDDSFIIIIDRTIPGGLDETPTGGNPWAFEFGVDYSTDGGTTWISAGGVGCPGSEQAGSLSNMDGRFPPGGNRRVRGWFVVPAGITTLQIAGSAETGLNISL